METSGTIYILRNTVNGKLYVGQTSTTFASRLRAHKCANVTVIDKAIKKYGINSFEKIIFTNIPFEWLDDIEIELINRLNTISPNGYNIHGGGQGKRIITKETRDKIRLSRLGKHNPNMYKMWEASRGRVKSPEERAKLSMAHRGKPKSQEHIEKANKTKRENGSILGSKNPSAKSIICFETKEVFTTMTEAARKYHLRLSGICQCCKGKTKTCGGFHWTYYE